MDELFSVSIINAIFLLNNEFHHYQVLLDIKVAHKRTFLPLYSGTGYQANLIEGLLLAAITQFKNLKFHSSITHFVKGGSYRDHRLVGY